MKLKEGQKIIIRKRICEVVTNKWNIIRKNLTNLEGIIYHVMPKGDEVMIKFKNGDSICLLTKEFILAPNNSRGRLKDRLRRKFN